MLIHACIHTLLHYYTLHWYMQTYVYVHTITLHYRTRQDKKIRHNTIQYIDFRHNIQYIQCIHYIHAYIHCTALHCITFLYINYIAFHYNTIQYTIHTCMDTCIHTYIIHTYLQAPPQSGGGLSKCKLRFCFFGLKNVRYIFEKTWNV